MRRLFALICVLAAALTTMLAVSAGPAMAHERFHNLEISGSMDIVDDDWPDSDDRRFVTYNGTRTVGPFRTTDSFATSGCSDEVRIELRVDLQDSTQFPGWVHADVTARMFEGTSCSSGDHDGTTTTSFWIAAGGSVSRTFRVNNTAEGGDRADVVVVVRNVII